jgi:hypothetical protein
MRCILTVALLLGIVSLKGAEAGSSPGYSLAKTLTPEEFAKAGLSKLTPEELAFLETALVRQQGVQSNARTTSSAAKPGKKGAPASDKGGPASLTREQVAADFGAEQVAQNRPAADVNEVRTHIEGTVQEFSGRAVFVLGNGQIWQQRTPQDVFLSKKLVNPEVTLIRTSLGYKMLIDAANVVVFVKRIQ